MKIFSITIIISLLIIFIINNCGIYATIEAPNPPFSISLDQQTLKFSGDDPDAGFILWYKENAEDDYTVCVYKNNDQDIPTIPKFAEIPANWIVYDDTDFPEVDYTLYISDLEHSVKGESFDILYNNDETHFYFAVSSYNEQDEVESEKVEFGLWPST